jgi:hypothetical protein
MFISKQFASVPHCVKQRWLLKQRDIDLCSVVFNSGVTAFPLTPFSCDTICQVLINFIIDQ